ncbi:hypothetical protein SAMN05444161_9014 [Rhizobiales bacterium GAS191]|nr:hypothetical protein SAMN05444161_9014 [Rhizobiales bacterium GAS191]
MSPMTPSQFQFAGFQSSDIVLLAQISLAGATAGRSSMVYARIDRATFDDYFELGGVTNRDRTKLVKQNMAFFDQVARSKYERGEFVERDVPGVRVADMLINRGDLPAPRR